MSPGRRPERIPSDTIWKTKEEVEQDQIGSKISSMTQREYDLNEVQQNLNLLWQRNTDVPPDPDDVELQNKAKELFTK